MFSQKLDFLMRLTKTSNTALGNSCAMSPSYISKLRSGARACPRDTSFLGPICSYLAKRITDAEYEEVICGLLKIDGPLPDPIPERADLLKKWLLCNPTPDLLRESTDFLPSGQSFVKEPELDVMKALSNTHSTRNMRLYYGISGRREAVLRLLSEISPRTTRQTILLYSDESLDWLVGDPQYAKLWSETVQKLLFNGNKLITIHSSRRTADEMYRAFRAWLPLYVTGQIELLYCPRILDGLFFHTMLIIPGVAALTSFSSSGDENDTLNTYYTNPEAINVLTKNFYGFAKKCLPLMEVCTPENTDQFWSYIVKLSETPGNSASMMKSLSSITFPKEAMLSISARADKMPPETFERFEVGLLTQLMEYQAWDMFSLPPIEDIATGRVPIPLSGMFCSERLYYTPQEFAYHINFVLYLIENFDSYHPYFCESIQEPYSIFVKEGAGVIVSNSGTQDLHLLRAGSSSYEYWDYLSTIRGRPGIIRDRKEIMRILRNYLAILM